MTNRYTDMSAAEHRAEAERLLEQSVTNRDDRTDWHDHLVARAQVHATLAQRAERPETKMSDIITLINAGKVPSPEEMQNLFDKIFGGKGRPKP